MLLRKKDHLLASGFLLLIILSWMEPHEWTRYILPSCGLYVVYLFIYVPLENQRSLPRTRQIIHQEENHGFLGEYLSFILKGAEQDQYINSTAVHHEMDDEGNNGTTESRVETERRPTPDEGNNGITESRVETERWPTPEYGFPSDYASSILEGVAEEDQRNLDWDYNPVVHHEMNYEGNNGTESKFETERGPTSNSRNQDDANGRWIGKLFISNTEIAKGSNGTSVFEGEFGRRKVAVKRMVKSHHQVAEKEIQNLIVSDQHPNIVRYYGEVSDRDFIYLSLEHCSCTLHDIITLYGDTPKSSVFPTTKEEEKDRLSKINSTLPDIELWERKGRPSTLSLKQMRRKGRPSTLSLKRMRGRPSTLSLKLMRDIVSGLVHLHKLGIIHRDIKPQNVLISKEPTICAKLSDMGISKHLPPDRSSLSYATGSGSSGWQPPEQLLRLPETPAVDVFSLGCVLYFLVTGGGHPFGDPDQRDARIKRDEKTLRLVNHIPEARDLFASLLQPDPKTRPKALEILGHPFFWNSARRLSFLCQTSDMMKTKVMNNLVLQELEKIDCMVWNTEGWDKKIDQLIIINALTKRPYEFSSVKDLLRIIRNTQTHYQDNPELQGILGPKTDGVDEYFTERFPKLLIEVYKVMCRHCMATEWFQQFIQDNNLY